MHSRALTTLAVLAGLVVPATAAAAARTVTVTPEAASVSWAGTSTFGFNTTWFTDAQAHKGACGTSPSDYCDDTLVHFTGEGPYDESTLTFGIGGYAHTDYDLRVYTSDETGAVGTYLGSPKGDGAGPLGKAITTGPGDGETVAGAAGTDSWFLVRVVYFAVAGDESYTGTVRWAGSVDTGEDEESEE